MRRFRLTAVLAATLAIAAPAADAKVLIAIDKAAQQMTVEVDGATRWTWPVSTGRRGYATPGGRFTAFRMEKEHFSKEWDDAPMPHSIFFTKQGHAIHGSYETKRLGTAASHGCVRLSPANAAKLFALVEQQGAANATVVVSEGEPPPARAAPRRNLSADDEAPSGYARPGYGNRTPSQGYPPPAYDPRVGYYAPQPYSPAYYYYRY